MKRSGKNEISAKGIGLLRRTAALLAALLLAVMSVAVGVLAEDATVLDVPPSPSYEEAAAPQAGEQPAAQAVEPALNASVGDASAGASSEQNNSTGSGSAHGKSESMTEKSATAQDGAPAAAPVLEKNKSDAPESSETDREADSDSAGNEAAPLRAPGAAEAPAAEPLRAPGEPQPAGEGETAADEVGEEPDPDGETDDDPDVSAEVKPGEATITEHLDVTGTDILDEKKTFDNSPEMEAEGEASGEEENGEEGETGEGGAEEESGEAAEEEKDPVVKNAIQKAIDAALGSLTNLSESITIEVESGAYDGDITISKDAVSKAFR